MSRIRLGFSRLLLVAGGLSPSLFGAADTPNPGLTYYYPAPDAPIVDLSADIVVYGGTSGGVTAAVQAVRMGKSVVLVVFGRHVGGMTSGGLTQTDGVNPRVQGGITREFFKATGHSGFKPSEAEQAFENLLADPVPGESGDTAIPVYYEQRLETVEKKGTQITALHMENGSIFRGKFFIDCTYEGDLMAGAGVSYTYGKESIETYQESRAGRKAPVRLPGVDAYKIPGDPGSGLIYNLLDEAPGKAGAGYPQIQAYNFRMYTLMNTHSAAMQPLFAPQEYDPEHFEILYRYHRAGGSTHLTVGNDINNHEMFHRGCATDHIGGNRWPDGDGGWSSWADADYATREQIYQSHVSWQLGMLWYLKTNTRYRSLAHDLSLSETIRGNIQNLLNKVDQLGFPLHEYPETGGWPHELYVREARRMVSDFILTQAYYDHRLTAPDPVGLANYSSDSHHVRRFAGSDGKVWIEGDTGGRRISPWKIPYRALIPPATECENLLVPWAISASSVAFASMRMEPCFMVLSQSAATAAALCIDRNVTVQELPYDHLRVRLLADGQILGEAREEETGMIIDNRHPEFFSKTGPWIESASIPGNYGADYLHDNRSDEERSAHFSPAIDKPGTYEVYLRWTAHTNRASNTPIQIHHQGETTKLEVDQRTHGGSWNLIGTYPFDAGQKIRVTINNKNADGYVIADAVRLVLTETKTSPARQNPFKPSPITREYSAE
ncbi:FAD-dependent oxidoreductase [Kiritimatiellaeota bacterium B1221]|nr:FAD-dependent oxidoreductase [Kiritimatiellaeota bacterium B1221]